MKKVLFDVNSIVPYYTVGRLFGVGRTTYELVQALDKLDKLPFELILFSQNLKGIGAKSLNTKFKTLHLYLPNRPLTKRMTSSLHLKQLISNYNILHIPHNTDIWENINKTIYTIHDLIVYRFPEMWTVSEHDKHDFNEISHNCKSIVTCSEASKNDLVKFWKMNPDKITVIPWGVNRDMFFPDSSDLNFYIDKQIEPNNYFFCASCNHPRKQPELIIEAFDKYIQLGGSHKLIMLNPYKFNIKYQHLVDKKHLYIVNNIDDKSLRWLYSNAKASIVVSLYEGFGLPVLESLSCHTQVICARNSSLVEAGGNIPEYLDDFSIDTLCNKFFLFEKLYKVATLDLNKVESHLQNFSWSRCAENYVNFWNSNLINS